MIILTQPLACLKKLSATNERKTELVNIASSLIGRDN